MGLRIGIIRKVREKVDTSAQGRTCQSKWGVFDGEGTRERLKGLTPTLRASHFTIPS